MAPQWISFLSKPPTHPTHPFHAPAKAQQPHRDNVGIVPSSGQAGPADDEEDEGVRTHWEAIGLHVGGNFVEVRSPRWIVSLESTSADYVATEVWVFCQEC
ncbi:hypothetical protein JVU11DRAFT_6192 [Chiua virens]|nr:hypothetical protein JVU11DRAFT_6192 [Chiua virens]